MPFSLVDTSLTILIALIAAILLTVEPSKVEFENLFE